MDGQIRAVAERGGRVANGGKPDPGHTRAPCLECHLVESARLERIVHPLVVAAELDFLRAAEKDGALLAVLEIPLLFETGADSRVDVTVVTSAPQEVQRARVLSRPGMTADKLEHLLARQLPDAERRARADYVVDSGTSLADMRIEIDKLIESLKSREGRVMDRLRRKD